MNERRQPESASEVLRHLISFAEDPEDVAIMSKEEIRAALVDEGVDLAAQSRRLQQRLTAIRGKQRLARAAEERARALQRRPATTSSLSPEAMRAEITRRLGQLGQAEAQAYFRNMEEATDADLAEMLKDLELLDVLHEESREEPGT